MTARRGSAPCASSPARDEGIVSATIFLVRHAAHDRVNSLLCGRMPGVALGERGRRQAAALANRFAAEGIEAVYASPMERAQETAAPIAARLGLDLRTEQGVTEIDFGAWTGRSFDSLADDQDWAFWNAARGSARPPGGESMGEAQIRAGEALRNLADRHPAGRIVVVSHCDVIKAAIAGLLELPLDNYGRFEISPASVSTLVLWQGGGKLLNLNECVDGERSA